jgi:hypothetical protein
MDRLRRAVLAAAAVPALLLTGCTAAGPTVGDSRASAPPSSSSPVYGQLGEQGVVQSCTEIGNAEWVSVDLSTALPQEGGDYYATVSVPSAGASSTTGFAGNDSYYPGGGVEADLTDAPTTVVVNVADQDGREVYRASGVGTPALFQPNGPACDGENYALGMVATPDGRLVPRQDDQYVVKDARGRWSSALWTSCGITDLTDDSTRSAGTVSYVRVGGPLVGPDGRAPAGWNLPAQRGWVSVVGDGLRFEDERGHSELFERAPVGYAAPRCPYGFSE